MIWPTLALALAPAAAAPARVTAPGWPGDATPRRTPPG